MAKVPTLRCPGDTKGWDVRDTNDNRRYYLPPDGRVFRQMRMTEGAKPDAIIRYYEGKVRVNERWLRQLGPRQAADALKSLGRGK